jgi:saccharopine dehydrogenase-like NADP-dependent oxidoreductase
MTHRVLIVGGRGHIGSKVAADLLKHTQAHLIITGRASAPHDAIGENLTSRVQYLSLDLSERGQVKQAILGVDLVIHCAGPFRWRDTFLLESCIEHGINYIDVSDDREFTQKTLAHSTAAHQAGITAVINTGVFPGISNSMVLQGIEQLDTPEEIHIRYVVVGSGGAGITVMRTTFLGLLHPFESWINGQWQTVEPFTGKECVEFPKPYGFKNVYWFDMPESITLAANFPVTTVTTKFGTSPDIYNQLTQLMVTRFSKRLMQKTWMINLMAQISYRMTNISDRFSGTGVAMRVEVTGQKNGQFHRLNLTFAHEDAATATGHGTGSIAQLILSGQLKQPGVFPVERILPTSLFLQTMQKRGIIIHQN